MSLLRDMISQYTRRHRRLPSQVVMTPKAAVALAIKGESCWSQDVTVIARKFSSAETRPPGRGNALGIALKPDLTQIVAVELSV